MILEGLQNCDKLAVSEADAWPRMDSMKGFMHYGVTSTHTKKVFFIKLISLGEVHTYHGVCVCVCEK